jgi:UrcA family protein
MSKYISLAIIVSALLSSAAHSETATDQVTVSVRYDDLDISRPAGVQALRQRIHAAARSVCGVEPSASDLSRAFLYHRCVTQAEQSAADKLARAVSDAHTTLARR